MGESAPRKPILTAQAVDRLQQAKAQILDGVAGRLSERLVLATARMALCLVKREAAPEEVVPEQILDLVRDSLRILAQGKWRPDTALKLQEPASESGSRQGKWRCIGTRKEGRDELSQ